MLNAFEIFEISRNEIKATVDCHVSLEIDNKNPPFETADMITAPGVLNFILDDQDEVATLTYPYSLQLNKTGEGVSNDIVNGSVIIHYRAGAIIIHQETTDSGVNIQTIKALLTGQSKNIKDPKTLTLLIADQVTGADLNHIELIVSTLYRVDDGKKPARLSGQYESAAMINPVTKTINDSWLSSISFRDINRGLSRGLVNEEAIAMNPIEKIINQDFTAVSHPK